MAPAWEALDDALSLMTKAEALGSRLSRAWLSGVGQRPGCLLFMRAVPGEPVLPRRAQRESGTCSPHLPHSLSAFSA